MDIFIKFMIMLSVFWVAVNAFMKFLPQYATQLPLSVYSFLYALTAQPWMIPGVNSCKQQPPSTPSPSSCLKRSRGNTKACAWTQKIYPLMIWKMWYWAGWLKGWGCFIRWSWKGWKVKERLSNRMTTQDKFVTGIILTMLVFGDQVVRLWWGWVQYVSSL